MMNLLSFNIDFKRNNFSTLFDNMMMVNIRSRLHKKLEKGSFSTIFSFSFHILQRESRFMVVFLLFKTTCNAEDGIDQVDRFLWVSNISFFNFQSSSSSGIHNRRTNKKDSLENFVERKFSFWLVSKDF